MKYLKIDQVAITPDLLPLKKFFTRPIGSFSLLRKSPERLKTFGSFRRMALCDTLSDQSLQACIRYEVTAASRF